MKKVFSVLTAGIFLLGALAAFSGCASEITDETVVEKIYKAVETAEMTQFEATSTLEMKIDAVDMDGTIKSTVRENSAIKAYEEGGELFADILTNEYIRTRSKSAASKLTTTQESYSMAFVRNNEAYTVSGEWKDVNAKKGKFPALIAELKQKDKVLKGSYASPSVGLKEDDIQSFGKLAKKTGAKVYKDGNGYFVKFDAEKLIERADGGLLEGLVGDNRASGGDIDGDFTVYVDSRFEVTAVEVELDVSLSENPSATSKFKMELEYEMELTVRANNPELVDLAGFTADMGRRLIPTQYPFPEEAVTMRTTLGNSIEGYCSATAIVTEDNKLLVEVTFREKEDSFRWSKSRKYDLNEDNSDEASFFEGQDYKPFEKVEEGIAYYLVTYSNGHTIGTLTVAKNFMQLVPEDYIKQL